MTSKQKPGSIKRKTNHTKALRQLSESFRFKEIIGSAGLAFYLFDIDKNGVMNVVELNNFFENYNHELTTAQQKNMLKNMDGDGNGRADFQEFITCLIFVKFDLDKNGGLSVDEVLTHLVNTKTTFE